MIKWLSYSKISRVLYKLRIPMQIWLFSMVILKYKLVLIIKIHKCQITIVQIKMNKAIQVTVSRNQIQIVIIILIQKKDLLLIMYCYVVLFLKTQNLPLLLLYILVWILKWWKPELKQRSRDLGLRLDLIKYKWLR